MTRQQITLRVCPGYETRAARLAITYRARPDDGLGTRLRMRDGVLYAAEDGAGETFMVWGPQDGHVRVVQGDRG